MKGVAGVALVYWILNIALAIWTFTDVKKREESGAWVFGVLLAGIVVLPVYLGIRSLNQGEIREGGPGWNIAKNFGILWTVFMILSAVVRFITITNQTPTISNDWEAAGYAIGATIGIGMLFVVWFVILMAALVIGLILRNSSEIEVGTDEIQG